MLSFGTVSNDCPRDITRIERNFNTTEYLRIQERAGYGTYGKNVALLPIPVHSSIAIAEWFVAGPLNSLPWPKTYRRDIFQLTMQTASRANVATAQKRKLYSHYQPQSTKAPRQ